MADAVVAPVEALRVQPVELSHCERQIRERRLHREVVVVAHEAVRVQDERVALDDLRDDVDERRAVSVVADNRPACVAARDHVVERAGIGDAGRTGHRRAR